MITAALVGASGTGKSYRSIRIAGERNLDYIIDDGILIYHGKIVEGSSAKKEATKIGAVLRAVFQDEKARRTMAKTIKACSPKGVLVLGTSEKMVEMIRTRLELPEFSEIIHIEDVATEEEISKARLMRESQGKHVIPVPVMEIRKTFSGYFLDPLSFFRKAPQSGISEDKSIVRPSYSYMGDFEINDTVLTDIVRFEMLRCKGISSVTRVSVEKIDGGAVFNAEVSLTYGEDIRKCVKSAVTKVKYAVEKYASIYTESVNVTVKSLEMPK